MDILCIGGSVSMPLVEKIQSCNTATWLRPRKVFHPLSKPEKPCNRKEAKEEFDTQLCCLNQVPLYAQSPLNSSENSLQDSD